MNHNIHLLKKSVGQVITLALFTYMEGHLKNQTRFLCIAMCTSFFVYMVFAMVILRIKEDFDISMGFLAAGYTLFFESSANGWEVLILVLVTYFLAAMKNFLIFGRGLVRPKSRRPFKGIRETVVKETVSPTEQKLIDFRTRVYLLSDLLGMLTLVSFLISCLSFCYLLEEETLEDYFLAIAWCIVIWSGTIILYTLRRTRLEKERE